VWKFCTLAPVKISIGTVVWPSSFLPQQTKASDSAIAQVCCPPAETACHHTLSEDRQMWSICRHWVRSYLNSKQLVVEVTFTVLTRLTALVLTFRTYYTSFSSHLISLDTGLCSLYSCLHLEQVVFRRHVCLSMSVVAPANQLGRINQYSARVRFPSRYNLQSVQPSGSRVSLCNSATAFNKTSSVEWQHVNDDGVSTLHRFHTVGRLFRHW